MSAATRFAATTRLGYTGTFFWTDPRSWIANVVIRPVLFLSVFGMVHRELGLGANQDLVIAVCAYNVAVTTVTGINHSIRHDTIEGTFAIAVTTPVRPWTVWVARAVAHLPNAVATGVVSVAFAALAFDVRLVGSAVGAVAAFATALASAAAIAMLAGVLTAHLRDWVGPVGITSGLMLLLSGVIIPRGALPPVVGEVSVIVPLAHANEALRRAMGAEAASPWAPVLAEVAVAAGVGTVALATFGWWLQRARRRGALTVEGS